MEATLETLTVYSNHSESTPSRAMYRPASTNIVLRNSACTSNVIVMIHTSSLGFDAGEQPDGHDTWLPVGKPRTTNTDSEGRKNNRNSVSHKTSTEGSSCAHVVWVQYHMFK